MATAMATAMTMSSSTHCQCGCETSSNDKGHQQNNHHEFAHFVLL
jgi:hypothetical protein